VKQFVYIAFDQDDNQAGQEGSHQLALRLQSIGIRAHIVQYEAIQTGRAAATQASESAGAAEDQRRGPRNRGYWEC
jgi:hypothetical protein